MKRIMTIVGTRPEIIKLSMVIPELEKYTEHILVHTGQNYDYELNEIFFKDMKIRKPDYFLDSAAKNASQTIANVISKSDSLMETIKPDALLLYGDTNSCLSVISAKRRKIPVFHMEAGNRSFDQRVPEELNRKIVDTLSDINMTITEHARKYLIKEGIRPETVIKIGSSMLEILNHYKNQINKSNILKKFKISSKKYFLVSMHREENLDNKKNFNNFVDSLNTIADKYKKKIIVSTHPRTKKKINSTKNLKFHSLIEFTKPLGFFDYIHLQKNSFCTISDSGTITEESSILGFPAITIRESHERPEGMDEGTLIMTGLKPVDVIDGIEVVVGQNKDKSKMKMIDDYNVDNVSKKVVRIILSHIDYINRTVWRK